MTSEKKKNGPFTGFPQVFHFTAQQNMKGSSFKTVTIVIALIIAALFAAISILMAVFQGGDSDDASIVGDDGNVSYENSVINEVYYTNKSSLSDEYIKMIFDTEYFNDIKLINEDIEIKDGVIDTDDKFTVVLKLEDIDNEVNATYTVPNDSNLSQEDVEVFAEVFNGYFEYIKLSGVEKLTKEAIELYNAPLYSQALIVGEEATDMGVMLAQLFIPMIFCLLLYMMILLYGQNITKVVVSEKSSKLMEMLLTSIRPYAIIAGKVLAISGIAILQMIIWIVSGIGGYMIGQQIAQSINPDYVNYLDLIIDVISTSSSAFSVPIIILSLLALVLGFLMYCVLAGLVAATVDKMEDISTAMALFQIPVIIGFLGSYFVTLLESSALINIVRYCPVTSPFILSADLMMGNMNVLEGIIALLILLATTIGLILFTGKVYKGKLFNRH